MEDGAIIGGLGISGGNWAQDQEADEEALRNFGQWHRQTKARDSIRQSDKPCTLDGKGNIEYSAI